MSREFKVGLIALFSGVLLYYGFNYLKGVDFFSPTNKYYVIYETVDGLNKSNPVIINGLAVGRVSRIRLLQNSENYILVELDIDEDIILGDSTIASLTNTDFLGSKGIVLTIGPLANPLTPGDTLIAYMDRGINEILESAQPVANNLNTTITRINEILIGLKGSGEKINATIDEVKETTISVNEIISQNQMELARIMQTTTLVLANLNAKMDKLDPIFRKTGGFLDSLNNLQLNATLASVRSAVDNLNVTITELKDEKGTIGKLMSNDSLYNNLNQSLIDLDKLIIHMDQYPKHFFAPLGKKHSKIMKELDQQE